MYIEKLLLKNFGKFNNYEVEFGRGLNVVYGENESGKSTLFSFIRGILFGVEKQRGRAAKGDIYTKLEPWDNPTFFEGKCQLVKGGVHYILDRRFYKGDKAFSIVNRDTGVRLFDSEAEDFFEGLSESRYINTISIGQTKPEDETELIKEIQNCIANLDISHGVKMDLDSAYKNLRDKKKDFGKKMYPEVPEGIKKTEDAIMLATYDSDKLAVQKEEEENVIRELEERKILFFSERKNKMTLKGIVSGALILILLTILVFIENKYAWIIAVLTSCVAGTAAVSILNTWRYYNKRFAGIDMELRDEGNELAKRELLLEQSREKLAKLETELEKLQEKLSVNQEYQSEINAVQMALDTLETLSLQLREEFSGKLNEKISQLVETFTCGEYNEIKMDKDGGVFVIKNDMLIPLEQLSKGTIEQIRLAVRIIVAEDVFGFEEIPIVLDEGFVYFDDTRLREILKSLARLDRQIIIFTCHKREISILQDEEVPFNKIILG